MPVARVRESSTRRNFGSGAKLYISPGVNYLRLSVTDRCNLRCIYCMPAEKRRFLSPRELLSFTEIVAAVNLLTRRGIEFVRITGGEPLVRRNIEVLIKMLRKTTRLKEISMTTNGTLLGDKLPLLIQSGLDRVNISLHTFKPERFTRITGENKLAWVLASIKDALTLPDFLLKINTVVLKGINDDEIEEFARFSLENKVCIRFIEYFPLKYCAAELQFVPNFLVKRKIERRFGSLIPVEIEGHGPAINYRINGARGQIGFIHTRTARFCSDCNRLRLSAEGRLFPCLFSPFSVNLKEWLRKNMHTEEITEKVDKLILKKGLYIRKEEGYKVVMSAMGG